MFDGFWHIIPIDQTEAMSAYSALLFVAVILACVFLYRQNSKLKEELDEKEKTLKKHTDDEASKLHERIESTLKKNSEDLRDSRGELKEIRCTMDKVDDKVISLTTSLKYIIKTMDEVKGTIEHIRNDK